MSSRVDQATMYMVLVSTFSSQIQSVLAFHALISADIERLANQPMKKSKVSFKLRMKMLGGIVFSYRRFSAELSILALAKVYEDTMVEAEELGCKRFNIWKGDDLALKYHHEMRYIRALANTVKHSQSRVIDNRHPSNRFLIDVCGIAPGSQVEYLRVDIPRYAYRVYWFLMQLVAYLTEVRAERVPTNERKGVRSFKAFILPGFLGLRVPGVARR